MPCPSKPRYPDGPRCEQIPLHAMIVAVFGVYDALSHSYPYFTSYPGALSAFLIIKDESLAIKKDLIFICHSWTWRKHVSSFISG